VQGQEVSSAMEAATIKFLHLLALIFYVLLLPSAGSTAPDTLNNGGNITDGETLVSAGGSFTLGFSPADALSSKRYLGIWFTASPDAVCWVANRDSPFSNTSGVLVISSTGVLRLLDGVSGRTAWSSNTTGASASAVAQLSDSGNLVVREQSSGAVLWQSFDHPSNTLLAGMRFGKNPQTGEEWSLTSWRASNDPATGDYRQVLDTKGLPESVLWQDSVKKFSTGPWNGLRFSGIPEIASYAGNFSVQVAVRPDEVAYVFNATAGAPFSRLVLNEESRTACWNGRRGTRPAGPGSSGCSRRGASATTTPSAVRSFCATRTARPRCSAAASWGSAPRRRRSGP
jgi:hypothetical protein